MQQWGKMAGLIKNKQSHVKKILILLPLLPIFCLADVLYCDAAVSAYDA